MVLERYGAKRIYENHEVVQLLLTAWEALKRYIKIICSSQLTINSKRSAKSFFDSIEVESFPVATGQTVLKIRLRS